MSLPSTPARLPKLLLASLIGAALAATAAAPAHAGGGRSAAPAADENGRLKQAPMPQLRQNLPPSEEQSRYRLSPSNKPRYDLLPRQQRNSVQPLSATPACKDMAVLAGHSGAALADYLVGLPDFECTYPLFSLSAEQAAVVYSAANYNAVASRLAQEGAAYNASGMALVNLVLYLRAGYYLAYSELGPMPPSALTTTLRGPIRQLAEGAALFRENPLALTTANETLKLITNMQDEAYYLPTLRGVVQRYTNRPDAPNAVEPLKQPTAAYGFTELLTVFFYASGRPAAQPALENDLSYATALNQFVRANKAALLNSNAAYQLTDASNEAFRFMRYPALKAGIKPMVVDLLASTSLNGADRDLWLTGAMAVKYNDNDNCAQYGTCGFETALANAVLKFSKTCSPTLRIRAQEMSEAQLQDSCQRLQTEEGYAHSMLLTKNTPVAGDGNASLELVVFDDYSNYSKYASVIYDILTDNGGMYLEGEPSAAGNQARFIAHEASWLRPNFQVWNLEHEYVHYLDGRFDLYGDFGQSTAKPTVWWIEGIAEYLSLKNNNQAAIDMARSGSYRLSEIFGNNYQMSDYSNRAYRWGYMATRFMVERHRADVDAVLGKFRLGDYDGYQSYMGQIGSRYDNEFASWAATASTAGEPPLPLPDDREWPTCPASPYLGKNCAVKNLASSTQAYAYIMLPAGARNVKLATVGGSGDVDMYVALDRYPSATSYDLSSVHAGNAESVAIAAPAIGRWYYITLQAKQPFSGVSVRASYD
ncbi:M9 family metallopeptidase [Rugamonas sp. DEMB1]|uniref:M9 family metallopeptidase n=1 Tax=Rugamonas sp. DEMB1 TaxID=3039386 RepID=UPI00244A1159|nr:M9 family metallopeptidase [Rugamonas sp. DEMB1]WGG49603.1 collagenase [Rugamonas sp. DEMB1]